MGNLIGECRARLQEAIAYCVTCQPYDGGEFIWVLGDQWELEDLLGDLDIPENIWGQVVDGIECPNCGNSIEYGDIVGTKDAYERQVEDAFEEWGRELRPLFDDFQLHLAKWPYLGLEHQLGQRIRGEIAGMRRIDIHEQCWHRARIPRNGEVMNAGDLLPPDSVRIEIPEGRYNHYGQAVFYLADSAEGAALESLGGQRGIAWVQEFQLSHYSDVLDLAPVDFGLPDATVGILAFGLYYGGVLELPVQRSRGWKPEYFIPRFIADCARIEGISGIRFRSAKSCGNNLVLFDWSESHARAKGEPNILAVGGEMEPPF